MPGRLSSDEQSALIEVSKTVNAHLDLDTVLESVMAVATEMLKVEASSLVLVDDATGDLLFHVAQGEKAEALKPIRIQAGQGVVGWVVESGEPAIVNDVTTDPRFSGSVDDQSGFQTKAILCVPLATSNRLWGAIEILNKLDDRPFDDHDLVLCEAVASQAAIAIENAMLHSKILETERLAAVGQTITGLAHCVKNVLNGIRGGSHMVDKGIQRDNSALIANGWDIVKRNSEFMQGLVMDMLSYSREREPELEQTDLNEILETVCSLMSKSAEEKGATITWTPNDGLRSVVLDPKGIQRCVLNLVSNAIDACESGQEGRVDVRTETNEDSFAIRVSDNGCGIAAEDKAHLFDLFFSTKGAQGTGLGLAVTRKIVEEGGGTITVESETGQGTAFTITLPTQHN